METIARQWGGGGGSVGSQEDKTPRGAKEGRTAEGGGRGGSLLTCSPLTKSVTPALERGPPAVWTRTTWYQRRGSSRKGRDTCQATGERGKCPPHRQRAAGGSGFGSGRRTRRGTNRPRMPAFPYIYIGETLGVDGAPSIPLRFPRHPRPPGLYQPPACFPLISKHNPFPPLHPPFARFPIPLGPSPPGLRDPRKQQTRISPGMRDAG